MKKYIQFGILIFVLLLSAGTSLAQLSATGARSIENSSIQPGKDTVVSITISTTSSQALSLMETLPSGWTLTRISDDADSFKAITNEWVWFSVGSGTNKTIKYRITAPASGTSGTYNIEGSVSNSSGVIASVAGDNSITVSGGGQASPTSAATTSSAVTQSAGNYGNVASTASKLRTSIIPGQEIVSVIPDQPTAGDNISMKVELTYTTAGYAMEFKEPSIMDKSILIDIKSSPPDGLAAQVITKYSHVYNLGYLGEGTYVYAISVNGLTGKRGSFKVSPKDAALTHIAAPPATPAKTPGFTMPAMVILISYVLSKVKNKKGFDGK